MPHYLSAGEVFKLRGFYLGNASLFGLEDRSKPREVLGNIVGHEVVSNNYFIGAKQTFSKAMIKLFESAIELKPVFIALRGHNAFYETLGARWDANIPGEVSTEDLIQIINCYVQARRNFRGSGNTAWQLTQLVDEWIEAVDHVARLPPPWTPTVVVTGQPNNVAGVTSQLQGVIFGGGLSPQDSDTWPPSHFQPSDKAYLLDPQVKHKLQGISPVFFGNSAPPALPNRRTIPADIKLFIAYWALRTSRPEKLWSICIVPIGPFWTTAERVHWKLAAGNCARTLATWDGFIQRANAAFAEGKTSAVGLLTIWLGSAEQVMAAAKASSIDNNQTMIWSQKCPRQGLAVILRRITVGGRQGVEYILYDPTLVCPRLRGEPWVKGALSYLFSFRQRLTDEVNKAYGGGLLRKRVGGQQTDLGGEPDSVEMAAAFIRSAVSADAADPFDMGEEEWRRIGFARN